MKDAEENIHYGRIWNEVQTAKYLGKSSSWLGRHRDRLERDGVPKVDPKLRGRDSRAILRFLDQRSDLDQMEHSQSALLKLRARNIANAERK